MWIVVLVIAWSLRRKNKYIQETLFKERKKHGADFFVCHIIFVVLLKSLRGMDCYKTTTAAIGAEGGDLMHRDE